jgi:hypothetical protein
MKHRSFDPLLPVNRAIAGVLGFSSTAAVNTFLAAAVIGGGQALYDAKSHVQSNPVLIYVGGAAAFAAVVIAGISHVHGWLTLRYVPPKEVGREWVTPADAIGICKARKDNGSLSLLFPSGTMADYPIEALKPAKE